MIRCDIEGASGVVSMEQASPHGGEFAAGMQGFMSDIMALTDGLNDAGVDEIHIYDEHFYGRNVDLATLPENVFVWCGKPPYTSDNAGGLDGSFSGLILQGLHAKAGTAGALLDHTYEGEIADITINGISVGEIGVEAAIAGEYGVPFILVTGDSAGVAEARELVPGVSGVSVKESIGHDTAICYPFQRTYADIRKAAKEAGEKAPSITPLRFTGPVSFAVTLKESPFLDRMRRNYFSCIHGGNQVVLERASVLEAYSAYWRMKLDCLG